MEREYPTSEQDGVIAPEVSEDTASELQGEKTKEDTDRDKRHAALRKTVFERFEKTGILDYYIELSTELENGPDVEASILRIAERFQSTPEIAHTVFTKYLEIMEAIWDVKAFLSHEFLAPITGDQIRDVANKILMKGNQFLVSFSQRLEEETNESYIQNLINQFENIKVEILLFTQSFKSLKEQRGKLDFADVKAASFSITPSQELHKDHQTLAAMKEIYTHNYETYPEPFRNELLKKFDERLTNPTARFYTLRYQGKLIAFNSFEDKSEGRRYFASFNVDPRFGNSRLGDAMMEQSLDREAHMHVIEADCDPRTAIARKYVEKGFVALKYYQYEGVPTLHIERDDVRNQNFRSKQISEKEVMQMATQGLKGEILVSQTPYVSGVLPDLAPLDQGYVLTRYFVPKEDPRTLYCVFEKLRTEKMETEETVTTSIPE